VVKKVVKTPKYEELGLTKFEYHQIINVLGREPNLVELAIYSLMWSEHCGYKHSKLLLKKLPTKADYVIQGPGENAGVIDLGNGLALAMKMESHNHPSAIEPFQGAATGVGGIVRDIFAMGARPTASLNSLRFGKLDQPRQQYLLEGVVYGIGSYGNCLGVPTVGGEVYFEDSYQGNCLVNAMTIGLLSKDKLTKASAAGAGNLVVLLGAKTGRDGIGGASVLASQEFDQTSEEKRPSVQVGDPFAEKLLIEVCLELLDKNLLVALGDLGAAGITSSASEMASRGEVGIDIEVDRIPLREADMETWEIMISESQERMLAIVEQKNLPKLLEVCQHWQVPASVIGKVTDELFLRVYRNGNLEASIPVKSLTEGVPVYPLEVKEPDYLRQTSKVDWESLKFSKDNSETLLTLLASDNLCSRAWIYHQYDYQVQTNTVVKPGADSAVLRLRGSKKAIALTTDGNGRYCYLDPFVGSQIAVAEAARNLTCSGARPLAITDCLNFGNPEKPEIGWQFKQSIEGISQACRQLSIPVISGNVSFYNESFGKPIYPTPVIGMVGLIEDVNLVCQPQFSQAGDLIVLVGDTKGELGGSEYLRTVHGLVAGQPPSIDLEEEKANQQFCRQAIKRNLINSAHDCSEGGLAVALAECCILGSIGATVNLSPLNNCQSEFEQARLLFGEDQSRFLLSLPERNFKLLKNLSESLEVKLEIIGKVGDDRLIINDTISLSVKEMANVWSRALAGRLGQVANG
jgi:phosphoribosylformylglycinamidine synthase